IHQKMLCCDWSDLDQLLQQIKGDIHSGKPSAIPFGWQALTESEQSLKLCAQIWNKTKYPRPKPIRKTQDHGTKPLNGKIRIGYVSGEFRDQATSALIVGLLESHDKLKFEVVGFDNGWDDSGVYRARINNAMNKIIEIRHSGDAIVATKIYDEKIDILVNLNG